MGVACMDETELIKNAKFYLLAEKEEINENIFKYLKDLNLEYGTNVTNEKLKAADVVMLYMTNNKKGEERIKEIRTQPNLFLKPLLVFLDENQSGLNGTVDDEIILPASRATLDSKIKKLLSISQKINRLNGFSEIGGDNRIKEILILQFLYTRNGYFLNPVRDLSSSIGYSYPLARLLIDGAPGNELELLEELEENLLLESKLIDKINLCPFCGHFQINFKEVCPQCHSLKINEEATIHHFRCAYVGREKEFKDALVLRCPKCRRELRHIGVDYDKPSEDLWCDKCGTNFSDSLVMCSCLNCGNTFSPENAIPKQIKKFSLTQEGYRAAEDGLFPSVNLMDILRQEIGLYRFEVFNELFRLEVNRCRRYEYNSMLIRLVINNLSKVINEGGIEHKKNVRKELGLFLKTVFRNTDILTELSENEYLIIFTHTESGGAERAMERLQEGIRTIFKSKIDLEYNMVNLKNENEDLESILVRMR